MSDAAAEPTGGRRAHGPEGREPPPVSGGLPVLGHTMEFLRSPLRLLERAQAEWGVVAAFEVLGRRMVALFGPEAQEAVFRAPDAVLSPSEAYKMMTPVFGKDVVYDAPPAKMAEQLRMLLPALQERRMRTYGEAVVRETEESIAEWGETGTFDLVSFCHRLTNFTASRCLLGAEFREGMSDTFARVYRDLERGVTPLAYVNAHLPLPAFVRRDRARARMVEMISGIVDARREGEREGQDFLQTLMGARYTDGRALNHHEITGLLLAALFAGHHTSAATAAWTMIELLRHPALAARAAAEVDEVFGGGAPVTHEALGRLAFVENAVKEALRLHPPLFMLVRVAKKDFPFGGYRIRAGSWIVVSPAVAHRMADVFADPRRFDPDRFAPPREEDRRDFAYIAFGGGRHRCLGSAFAVLQIKAILALLLGRYDLELAGDRVVPDFGALVVGPKEPCRVRYRRRERPSVAAMAVQELARIAAAAEPDASVGGKPAERGGCPALAAPAAAGGDGVGVSVVTVAVDKEVCRGHGVCVGAAPRVFRLGSDGKVELLEAQPPVEETGRAREAARRCPTGAISIRGVGG